MFNPITFKNGFIVLFVIFMGATFPPESLAENKAYTSLPPFISGGAKANVIFVTDFSGSMQGQAYYETEWDGYYDSHVADYGDDGENFANYDSGTEYYGYFDPDKYYFYNSSNKYWEPDTATPYANREAGNKNSLSGNFLNFLVTTRVDAVLKNLIGGKAECPSNQDYCILEPQGARRWVEVTNLDANCYVRPEDHWTGSYENKDIIISVEDVSGKTSDIGTFSDRYARVKIDADDRSGIIQENFSKVRFGFIAYANTSNDTAEQGMIKYGVHQNSLDTLITSIEETIPYSGTHTGEALREAYYYLAQDTSTKSYNDSYIDEGQEKDPLYEEQDDGSLEPAWCRKNFVVLISDGEWNGDEDPDEWSHNLHIKDLRETDNGGADDKFPGGQHANVYALFAFSDDINGEESMKTVAAFGSYEDLDADNTPYTLSESTDSKDNSYPRSNCDPTGTYDTACKEWDSADKNGTPDTFYYASNGQAMSDALADIFATIRQGTSSGTAVTALTSKISSGNVVVQGAFYPSKEFDDGISVNWTGDVFAEWYLNGYYANADGDSVLVQNIREDTNSNYTLNVETDRILEYLIEDGALTIDAYDSDSHGTKADDTSDQTYLSIEDAANLFDCGEQLKTRKPSDRTIYGVSESNNLVLFTESNVNEFDALLGSSASEYPDCLLDSGTQQYEDLINYTRGEDISQCRSRETNNQTSENVWKIGDIIYSSPTVVEYDNFSMIYTGSNAGMLHAFRLGYLKTYTDTLNPAKLCDDSSAATCTQASTGKEEWAFIPKDAMPYLRYMADPDYDHIYSVDLKPYIINTGSKMILIGGMRMGGACNNGSINPPSDTDPVGRSAYFALDITDPLAPEYLWKYAPDGMGFTYSGPAYVKRQDDNGDWHHFVIFASGPTDYEGHSTQNLEIYTVDLFTGEQKHVFGDDVSEMNIKNAFGGRLFTHGLDVNNDGQTDFVFLGITSNADGDFSKHVGGMIKIYTAVYDKKTDAVDLTESADPTQWTYDTGYLTFAINPLIAPVRTMDCFPDELDYPFLYFGTGRYFSSDDQTQDGTNDLNQLYGVPFTYNEKNLGGSSINSVSNSSDLTCDTLNAINTNPNQAAWYIDLEAASGNYLRERCYSDPTTTDYNMVFFSTTKPTDVTCECGGQSRTWAVNCATGQSIFDIICDGEDEDATQYVVDEEIQFNYLVQLSGGDIQQYKEKSFTEEDNRSTAWSEGVNAETGGLPTFPPKSALGQILYWKQW